MKRYVPPFILSKLSEGKLHGEMQGMVALMDIKDFSMISNRFLQEGKLGAELLAAYLHQAFSEPIQMMIDLGGFISLFIGDAVCFVFPEPFQPGFYSMGERVSQKMREPASFATPFKDFPIVIRQIASFGQIRWDIFSTDQQTEYLFSGQAFHDLQELKSLEQMFSFSADIKDFFELKRKPKTTRAQSLVAPATYQFEPGLEKQFTHPRFHSLNPENEVRIAATCFISFSDIKVSEYKACIRDIARQAEIHNAFVNKLDYTENGMVALVLFGVPQSEGHTLFKICDFSLKIMQLHPQLAIGIGWGNVFAGYVGNTKVQEYSVLGDSPNRTYRLMGLAKAGEIITGSILWGDAHYHYELKYVDDIMYKGIEEPLPYYRLLGKKARVMDQYHFIGRKKETGVILSKLQQAVLRREKLAIYVCGDPGIGKSRLLQEVLLQIPQEDCFIFSHHCDSTLEPSLELVKHFLREALSLDRTELIDAAKEHFEMQWTVLEEQFPALADLKPVIGSLYDLSWTSSIWESTDPKDRPELLQQSVAEFVKIIHRDKVLLLNIDDGQWVDSESLEILRLLSGQKDCHLVIVSACRYLPGANRVDFKLPDYNNLYLELSALSAKESVQLVTEILGGEIKTGQAKTLAGRTMGNPLYIENMSSYVKEAESVESGLGKMLKDEGFKNLGLSDVIFYRLDILDKNIRECVMAASVLGMEFDTDILTEMMKRDISLELEHCSRHRIWYPTSNAHYSFSHVLIKDNAYSMMMQQKLTKHHQAAAAAMEIRYSSALEANAEQIAYHYEKAGLKVQAAKHYNLAADYLWEKVQFANSASLFQKAYTILENHPDADPLEYGEYIFHHGLLLHYLNDYPAAEKLYLQNMEIQNRHRPKGSFEFSPYINNLGRLYKDMELFSKAEPLLKKTLEIELKWKRGHGSIADRENNLAHLYTKQGKHKKALPLYLSALEGMKKEIGPGSFHTGFMLGNVGMTYLALGKLDLAAPMLLQSIEVKTKHYGPDHPEMSTAYSNLGRYYLLKDEPDQAEEFFHKTLRIDSEAFGPEHPKNIKSLYELYRLALKRNEIKIATRYKNRMRTIATLHTQLNSQDRKVLTEIGIRLQNGE